MAKIRKESTPSAGRGGKHFEIAAAFGLAMTNPLPQAAGLNMEENPVIQDDGAKRPAKVARLTRIQKTVDKRHNCLKYKELRPKLTLGTGAGIVFALEVY
ncbi:MAG: hypothetical protein WC476_07575 [Phycisphaerae bacterium]|jgi:hypothetical protein